MRLPIVIPLDSGSIGHFVRDFDITEATYSQEDHFASKWKLFYVPRSIVCNKYFLSLIKTHKKLVPHVPFFWIYRLSRKISRTYALHYDILMEKNIARLATWHNSPPLFTPSEDDVAEVLRPLEKWVDISRPFITLVVRDSGYDKHYGMLHNDKGIVERNSYRNTPINAFLPLIRFFTNKGFTVIRMGRHSDTSMQVTEPNYFDYSIESRLHSDKADVVIPFLSEFGISTGSGVDEFLNFFRKPIYRINVSPPGTIPTSKISSLNLIPDYIDSVSGHRLPLDLILQAPFLTTPPYKLQVANIASIRQKGAEALLEFAQLVHALQNRRSVNSLSHSFQASGPYLY